MVERTRKFDEFARDGHIGFEYDNTFAKQETTGPDRLIIAPRAGQIELLKDLTQVLPEPFGVLYVLLVPRRSNHNSGRYQSPRACARTEMEVFLDQFKEYFEGDGRHHIWVVSLPVQSTIVYDCHNILYVYGPLAEFETKLLERGLSAANQVEIPHPHIHNYYDRFDAFEDEIMNYWEWEWYPLAEGDDD